MSIVMFADTETNSLDTENGFIMEIAWILYHVECQRLLSAKSYFLNWQQLYTVDPEASAVTGLTRGFCQEVGQLAPVVLDEFRDDLSTADHLCGHNLISFDKPMINSNIKRLNLAPQSLFQEPPSMLDTLYDCPYPLNQNMMKLKYLAFDHGYQLVDAHSALADVFACKHIFTKYPFEKILEISKTPLINVQAYCGWDEPEKHSILKRGRFYFNKPKKCWEKKVREYFLPELEAGLSCQIDLELEQL